MTVEPERFPGIKMYLRHIDQAAQGLTGLGMVLNAVLLADDYEEDPENQILANYRLAGGLYDCIEILAWFISTEVDDIKEMLEKIGQVKENKQRGP